MRPRAAIVALTCVVLLAACGSSGSKPSSGGVPVPASTPTTGPTTSTTQTTQTAPATTTTTTSTPTTSAQAPPPCVTADFALRYLGQDGATGHGEVGFALRNTTSHQCRTYGYPGILFLSQSGAALPTSPTHTTVDFFGTTSKNELVVLPGADVSFRLGVNHGAGSTSGCTTAYGLQVIAPNDTHTTRVTIPDGVDECGGDATVSPLQAADLAFTH